MEIDVSKCEHYVSSKNLDWNCKETPQSYYCKNRPDCDYKQLQQLKQENIELEQRLDDEMLRTTQLGTEIMSLEKEKRKLKQENEVLKENYKKIIFLVEKYGFEKDKIYFDKTLKKCYQYEQKLEKIKECCISISNDDKAMSGEHLLAEDVLEIIESEE